MPPPSRVPSPANRDSLGTWLFLAALLAYAVFLWQHAVVVPGGSDSSGYFNAARALTEGRVQMAPRELPGLPMAELPSFAYTPLGFVPRADIPALIPSYPVGLPALFAAAASVLGWQFGPALVLWLHAVGGVGLVFLLARTSGLARVTAGLGAVAIAVSPLTVMLSLQAMSDVPAMFWCALALHSALHGGRRVALLAGGAIGMAVLIRPTNALVVLPVLVAFGADWRRWLLGGLGGLPAAAFLGWHNWQAYGAILATGYGDVRSAFGFTWLGTTLWNYARWVPVLLSPLVLLAPAALGVRQELRRPALVHAIWVALLGGFYSAYYHTHEAWWYLRFVLPAFPSLVILAALGAERLSVDTRVEARRIAWMACLVLLVLNGLYWCRHLGAHHAGLDERAYPEAIGTIRREVPADGVVLAMQLSGAIYHSTDLTIIRWDQLEGQWPRVRAATAQTGRPVYAALFAFELEQGFAEKAPGNWTKVAESGTFTLWHLSPGPP